MLQEIAKERLNEMEAWTVEKFDLMAELHSMKLGEAIAKANLVWPEYGNDSWDDVRKLAGEDDKHRFIAFLLEDRGSRWQYPADEEHYFRAKLYGDAASILRECGVSSYEELPEADQQLFSRWLEVGEGSATSPQYDLNEAVNVPIPEGVTDGMLKLLYADYTPEELRESAKVQDGAADLIDIQEQQEQRDIKAMSEGLQAQFGRRYQGEERMYEHVKAELMIDLAGDRNHRHGPRASDRRLIAVSQAVLSPEQHEKLMAEIEDEFAGWCRECGTMPGLAGCSSCPPGRQPAGASLVSGREPF